MKNLYILIVVALFAAPFHIISQKKLIKEFSVNWSSLSDDADLHPFTFDEAIGKDEKSDYPKTFVRIPITQFIEIDDVELTYQLQCSEITNNEQLEFIDEQEPGQFITKRIITISHQNYVQLEIVPLYFNEKTEKYELVDKATFEVVIPDQKSMSALKSSTEQLNGSVLQDGKWIKISITETGIHKITYSQLSSWGISNPQNVKLFGNGGNMLPRANSDFRHYDLKENAIWHENNAIYFYGQGPVAWHYNSSRQMFEHQIHDYTDHAFYFLTEDKGDGLQVQTYENKDLTANIETDEFDSYQYHEWDNQNIMHSGIEWYGERFDAGQERSFAFSFDHLVQEKDIKLLVNAAGRSNVTSSFEVMYKGDDIKSIWIPSIDYEEHVGSFAREGIRNTTFSASDNTVEIDLLYDTSSSSASGWLNFLCLNAKEQIVYNNKQLMFRNADVVGPSNITRFTIDQANDNAVLWNVTNHTEPIEVNLSDATSGKSFVYKTEAIEEFVIFNPDADLLQVEFEETVENQNIKGISVPEMLIVSHPLFLDEAKRLAEIHQKHSGLHSEIVMPYQIYNEFSSGSPDISAIRDYARFLYNQNKGFKYLLLFGDGSYDNKNYNEKNSNFILTFQSDHSLSTTESYTSDDFYGFLDNNEGESMLSGYLDIGIGRFPVSSIQQATDVVNKIDKYLNEGDVGSWKTKVTFLADDGDGNLHMRDADGLSTQVYNDYPAFNQNKIYFDAYPKVTTSLGDRYPEVNSKIKEVIESGTLIFNYTGHGSERQLGHENVLDVTAIKQLNNLNRLPVFVTATCEFSRYDNYNETSAGEWVILSPNGGGVGLFTTTRLAWSSLNLQINKNFYKQIFRKETNGNKLRLGDVIKATKNNSDNSVNKLNFTLLGDPALELSYPTNNIETYSINGNDDLSKKDTLKAITKAEVGGQLEVNGQETTVGIQVFDKPVVVSTLGNKGATPFEYSVYQNRIFKGEVETNDELFEASFVIPKDIRYNIGKGRISYYSFDENGVESFGADNTILVGGVGDNPPDDETGPSINLWLNDSTFVSGGITGTQPILVANVEDESGINTSGVGIGHDISLIIDGDRSKSINLNGYYTADKGTFTKGKITFQLPAQAMGKHTLELKVWDNLNNSSVASLDFNVELDGGLLITDTKVYPNPISPGNSIFIDFTHDAPNQFLDCVSEIYSLDGRLIERHEITVPASGTSIAPIEWVPSSMQRGVYILRCEIRSAENQVGKFSKKILVVK